MRFSGLPESHLNNNNKKKPNKNQNQKLRVLSCLFNRSGVSEL